MSSNTFFKVVVAFGLLAIVLIFLGVNYVPRISAFSPANGITFDAKLIRGVEAARWQALGEAYLPVNLRARQADATRWQAMGEYYSKHSPLVSNFDAKLIHDVEAARWQALGDAYSTVDSRARLADATRWQALGEYYSKRSAPVPNFGADIYAGSDYIERHPSNYYTNSDWIERHP